MLGHSTCKAAPGSPRGKVRLAYTAFIESRINIPTNGQTIYVTLWTQVHATWQTPLNYTYSATNSA